MKKEIIMLILIMGCTARPVIEITGLTEVTFQKNVNFANQDFNYYYWEDNNSYKIVKEHGQKNNYFQSWEQTFLSVYEPSVAPYPGAVTKEIFCEEYYKPEKINSKKTNLSYTAFTNSRGAIGVCAEELIAYHCLFSFLQCSDKLYEIEYCIASNGEKHNFTEFLEKINC